MSIMNHLRLDTLMVPAADFPQENPLPPLAGTNTASAVIPNDVAADAYSDRGWEASLLPYRLQDQYTRERRPRPFRVAVLENDFLRATFMLQLGGRLWSLYDKQAEQELLFVNPVFQPANLAARDAWFSGGVEWNIGIIGHCPLTCDPLFAARVDDAGRPVLRLYEFERIRRVPFQIDCWLNDTRPLLYVRPRILNPHEVTIPMYWWSNIAVPEAPDVRVLSPADKAYRHDYDGKLVAHDVPMYEGMDVSYPAHRPAAADLYFRIPPGHRPWIASLDGKGLGLVHTSTQRLFGRKMFNWGTNSGGRHWQEFLAEPGHAYIEIQGGLCPTQGEYAPMPPRTEWSWLEAYGPLQADPAVVHGRDWHAAFTHAERRLDALISRDTLDREFEQTAALADRAPAEILHHGSGWAALEQRRKTLAPVPALPFPESTLGPDQAPWLALLRDGALPARDSADGIGTLQSSSAWRELLETSLARGGDHWLTWVHLGIARYRGGDLAGARSAWEASIEATPTAWAFRNLAVLAAAQADVDNAIELYLEAAGLAPDLVPLAIEAAGAMLTFGRFDELLEFVATRPPAVRNAGRIRLLHTEASLQKGNLETVRAFFDRPMDIANIREKEIALSELWFGWQRAKEERKLGRPLAETERLQLRKDRPPPAEFDFRLNDR
jgi:tetratricopeptide (TPR) repeat protein